MQAVFRREKKIYFVDSNPPQVFSRLGEIVAIAEPATTGVPKLVEMLSEV